VLIGDRFEEAKRRRGRALDAEKNFEEDLKRRVDKKRGHLAVKSEIRSAELQPEYERSTFVPSKHGPLFRLLRHLFALFVFSGISVVLHTSGPSRRPRVAICERSIACPNRFDGQQNVLASEDLSSAAASSSRSKRSRQPRRCKLPAPVIRKLT
jgi:hypothetical protein